MLLLLGLGNPGEEYQSTPHNVGFEALDYFYQQNQENCTPWKLDKKSKTLVARCKGVNKVNKAIELILAKPQTFMNLSGNSVKLLTTNYQLPTEKIVILHDDIDLPQGTVRIRKNGSSAGHKGVQNIIDALGTQEFGRIRIGIRPNENDKVTNVEKFVLKKFGKEKQKIFQQVYQKVHESILEIVEKGIEEKTVTLS